jgi:two-component sensor histidine kinase
MGTVVGLVSTLPLMHRLEEAARHDLHRTAQMTARAVGEFAHSAQDMARQITSRTRIRQALAAYETGSTSRESLRDFTEPKLSDALRLSMHAVGITRLDARDTVVAQVGEAIPDRLHIAPNTVSLRDFAGPTATAPRFLVAAPIRTRDGSRIGTDLVLFDATSIRGLLQPEDTSGGSMPRSVALFNDRALRATGAGGFGPGLDSKWSWNEERGEPTYADSGWVTTAAGVPQTPWAVAMSIPKSSLYAPIRAQAQRILFSVAIILVFGIAGALVALRPLAGNLIVRSEELERELARATADAEEQRTRAEQALEDQKELMRELTHRVKNNLNMVSSLVQLKNAALGSDADLSDISNQIEAIQIVHQKLHQTTDVSHIDLRSYVADLLRTIFASFADQEVHVENRVPELSIRTKTAVSLGLIVNETATNAIKHGFTETEEARFTVALEEETDGERYRFTISNSGRPFPADIDPEKADTLGLRLISALAGQLQGTIELERRPAPVFHIRFPKAVA